MSAAQQARLGETLRTAVCDQGDTTLLGCLPSSARAQQWLCQGTIWGSAGPQQNRRAPTSSKDKKWKGFGLSDSSCSTTHLCSTTSASPRAAGIMSCFAKENICSSLGPRGLIGEGWEHTKPTLLGPCLALSPLPPPSSLSAFVWN